MIVGIGSVKLFSGEGLRAAMRQDRNSRGESVVEKFTE
jgi:hypothetical protein